MRRRLIAIGITLPILLLIGIGSMLITQHLSRTYVENIQRMEALARAGDYEGAQRQLTEVAEKWSKWEPWLQIWVNHSETDEVTTNIKAVQVGLVLEDEVLLFSHSTLLIEALDHLHHRDDLTVSNIL